MNPENISEQENKQNTAIIAVVITSEFYRPILLKTLLSHTEVDYMLRECALECTKHFANLPEGYVVSIGENRREQERDTYIEWAKSYLFENHHLKL